MKLLNTQLYMSASDMAEYLDQQRADHEQAMIDLNGIAIDDDVMEAINDFNTREECEIPF